MSSLLKTIKLKSFDLEFEVEVEVEEAVALESQILKYVIEDVYTGDDCIPLPNVTSKILLKVIEYCKMHIDAAKPDKKMSEDDLKAWDWEFVEVDKPMLIDLFLAADYLNIRGLLDLTCQKLKMTLLNINPNIPEELRMTLLNMKNDVSPGEEEEVHREN